MLVRASKLGPTRKLGHLQLYRKRNGTDSSNHSQKIAESFVPPYKMSCQLNDIQHGSPSLEARTSEGFWLFQDKFEGSNKKISVSSFKDRRSKPGAAFECFHTNPQKSCWFELQSSDPRES
ncbi:hypothetical protein COR50_11185 [Chitinophaga caeni]|uniref:Uncharacterized protein n=1 Tax=Chitinophaga caeni TaxID=2029983 RepID=A0A291QUS3_9BACT|nr:hypothetical protein COR50_11185 [Chitinophaga caeni]